MTRQIMGLALVIGLAGCGGTPPFGGGVGSGEGDGDTSGNSAFLTEDNPRLTLNNIAYDPTTDTLTLNNIPFDDPLNAYERIPTNDFNNGFNAYQSAPDPGSNQIQYFAVFRRSDSGLTQVASAGTTAYVDFGYGGAGAQRLGAAPTLPTTGIYSYNGEYAGVRTTNAAAGNSINYTTGSASLAVDFDDLDNTGAVGGLITNRQIYGTDGALIGGLDGFISLRDTDIDFTNGTIVSSTATEFQQNTTRSGTWQGVFAGPGGREIAGILFVEGGDVREVGGMIVTCVDTPGVTCP